MTDVVSTLHHRQSSVSVDHEILTLPLKQLTNQVKSTGYHVARFLRDPTRRASVLSLFSFIAYYQSSISRHRQLAAHRQ